MKILKATKRSESNFSKGVVTGKFYPCNEDCKQIDLVIDDNGCTEFYTKDVEISQSQDSYNSIRIDKKEISLVETNEFLDYNDNEVEFVESIENLDTEYSEFVTLAEKELTAYVAKCVEAGGRTQEDEDNMYFEEHIDNKDFLKPTDSVEVRFVDSDYRYSFFKSTLEVIDTSC